MSSSVPTTMTTTTTTPPSSHRRKSSKVKRIPRPDDVHENVASTSLCVNEENTNSIDDLPLGERTSPSKPVNQTVQTVSVLSTPINRKRANSSKKKSSNKRSNNIVGVAVIEERRVKHHLVSPRTPFSTPS